MRKTRFAFLPRIVNIVGMKDEYAMTLIWLKKYYIDLNVNEQEYESLNGDMIKREMEYIFPSQAKFTFLSFAKLFGFVGINAIFSNYIYMLITLLM